MSCTNFTHPTTLLQCLQLLASLSKENKSQTVKSEVIQKLKSEDYLGKYCDEEKYLNEKFAKPGSSGYLDNVFMGSYALLNKLLKTFSYGPYHDLDEKYSECADEIVEALKTYLPQAYSALYFLYFNVSSNVQTGLQGGHWRDQWLRGSHDSSGLELQNWLTGQTEPKLTPGLIPRGLVASDLQAVKAETVSRTVESGVRAYADRGRAIGVELKTDKTDTLSGSTSAQLGLQSSSHSGSATGVGVKTDKCTTTKPPEPVCTSAGVVSVCGYEYTFACAREEEEKETKTKTECTSDAMVHQSYSGQGRGTTVGFQAGLTGTESKSTGVAVQSSTDSRSGRDISSGSKKETSGTVLRGTQGSDLVYPLWSLVSHSYAKPLQKALLGMLFLGQWHDSKLGHGILFLYYFCLKAPTLKTQFENAVPGGDFNNFLNHCSGLKSKLDPFIDGSQINIQAVCRTGNTDLYNGVWGSKPNKFTEKFQPCLLWFTQNLYYIISSLECMSSESTKWTQENLKNASTAGPFRFGFVFKSWSGTSSSSKLKDPVTELTESLKSFLETLFPPPTTLLQCLQLCARLKDLTKLSSNVIERLRSMLQPYCDGEYLDKKFEPYLNSVFKGSHDLLTQMLENPSVYGPYAYLPDTASPHSDPIVAWCCGVLIEYLPRVYSALYFLYFNVNKDFTQLGGGTWNEHVLGQDNQNLHKWLKDQSKSDKPKPDPSEDLKKRGLVSPEFIKRGFKDELKKNSSGQNLVPSLSKLISHNIAMDLQSALLGMLFLGDWHDSKLGHGVLFLYEFCLKAPQTRQPEALKSVFPGTLDRLKASLSKFIGQNAPSGLSAVCWQNANLYNEVFDPSKLEKYVEWLKENWMKSVPEEAEESEEEPSPSAPNGFLPWLKDRLSRPFVTAWNRVRDRAVNAWKNLTSTIDSLKKMREESGKLTKKKLDKGESAGPFRFGFVPQQEYDRDFDWDTVTSGLSAALDDLSKGLESLFHDLDPLAYALWTGGSAAGTVGGVGAVGGGAYYAYSQYGSTVTPGVSALLDEVTAYGFSVSDLAGAGLHCPLQ